MSRRPLFAAFAFTALAAFGAAGRAPAPAAADGVHALEYEVSLPGGTVEYHFQVAAADDEAAEAAAMAAIRQLAPGAPVRGLHETRDGTVAAAFVFWPWQWTDEELPVATWYNPTGAPVGVHDVDVTDALIPWSSVATSRFAFSLAGTTGAAPGMHQRVSDGRNVIGWLDLGCDQGCVLGLTSKVRETHEVDIVLNSNPAAALGDGSGGTVDVTTVVLHEAGHMAGLDHSCAPLGQCSEQSQAAVMYYRYRGAMHELGPDDIAGISALYPGQRLVAAGPDLPQPAPRPTLNLMTRVEPGWNLVVLAAGPLDEMMRALPCVRSVYGAAGDGWVHWLRDSPAALNTLVTADGERAYWVEASAACSASVGPV